MVMYGYAWLCSLTYGYVALHMAMQGHVAQCMAMHGCVGLCMGACTVMQRNVWLCMGYVGRRTGSSLGCAPGCDAGGREFDRTDTQGL